MSDDLRQIIAGITTGLITIIASKIIGKQNLLKGVKMEKDIVDGKIGEVGSYDIEFKQGKLKFVVKAAAPFGVDAVIGVEIGADAVIDAIKKAIPGQIDDAILDVLKNALKA